MSRCERINQREEARLRSRTMEVAGAPCSGREKMEDGGSEGGDT